MSWNILSDFWDDYDYREIVEIIWNNYEDLVQEEEEMLKAVNNSKSIKTLPYEIPKKWKKLKFKVVDDKLHLKTDFKEVLTNIKGNVYDKNLNPLVIEDNEGNEIDYLLSVKDIPFKNEIGVYNPIEFRKVGGDTFGVSYLEDYIEDDVLEIWIEEYAVHNKIILELYSEMANLNRRIFDVNRYSKEFYHIVRSMWYVLVNGPTIKNITIGLYLFYGLPLTLVDKAEITIWEEGHIALSTGEEWEFEESFVRIENYTDEDGNIQEVNGVGDVIPPFTPLVKGIEIQDYISHPNWWDTIRYYEDVDIEKYSTMFVEVTGRSYGNQRRDLTVLNDFLKRITPEYLDFMLFLVSNADDGLDGEYSPGDGLDGFGPGDSGEWVDNEDGDYQFGSEDGYLEGKKIDDAQNTDFEGEPGKRIDPYFTKEIEGSIRDGRPTFTDYPNIGYSYGEQYREYTFDGELKFDNFGDELEITAINGNTGEEKKLRNY